MPLYHFTDPRNLPSIREHGLLSWQQLEDRGIKHFRASDQLSRKLDSDKGLQNYVRLYSQRTCEMLVQARKQGRIRFPVWLEIDRAVTLLETTRFSNRNATRGGVRITNDPITAFGSKDPQAEILVFGSIAPEWITVSTVDDLDDDALP